MYISPNRHCNSLVAFNFVSLTCLFLYNPELSRTVFWKIACLPSRRRLLSYLNKLIDLVFALMRIVQKENLWKQKTTLTFNELYFPHLFANKSWKCSYSFEVSTFKLLLEVSVAFYQHFPKLYPSLNQSSLFLH